MVSTCVMWVSLGVLGRLCQARLKVHLATLPSLPVSGGDCQGKEQKGTKSEVPLLWHVSQTQQRAVIGLATLQHKVPHPAGWLFFCSVCKASCVAGDRSPCVVPQFLYLDREVDEHFLLLWSAVETSSFKHFEVL